MPLFLKELQGVTVCSRFGSNFIKQKIQVKNNHSVNQLQIDPAIKKSELTVLQIIFQLLRMKQG